MEPEQLVVKPVTIAEWPDMQALFTATPSWGCWCMYWRGSRADFKQQKAAGHKAAMEKIIQNGRVPGLLAYRADAPVGWVSVGPRSDYIALENSRVLKRIDDQPVWSIVCFLAARSERGKGILSSLITAAVEYAAGHGAAIVEAYPYIPQEGRVKNLNDYMGVLPTYLKMGFSEIARPSATRAVVRYLVNQPEEN